VVSKAASGSKGARQALDEAGADLGMALASLVHVLGPDTILLGGGAFDAAEELLLEPTRAALFGSVQPFFGSRLRLGRAQLGNDAGVVGAAALFG
jgi:glucokinase